MRFSANRFDRFRRDIRVYDKRLYAGDKALGVEPSIGADNNFFFFRSPIANASSVHLRFRFQGCLTSLHT